jgi:chaperonin GroEL
MGVIDPKKVTRSALQNATTIALLLITTEAAIAEQQEKTLWQPPAGYRMPGNKGFDHKY